MMLTQLVLVFRFKSKSQQTKTAVFVEIRGSTGSQRPLQD